MNGLIHVVVPSMQKEHNKCMFSACLLFILLLSLLCFFQAMRFPPKSYNKDLESAEVSPSALDKTESSNFPTEREEGGSFWKGWEQL